MTEEEIYARAVRDYPEGTVFISAYNKKEGISNGLIEKGTDGYFTSGRYVYDCTSKHYPDGWAPIVKKAKPEIVTEYLIY